MSPRTPRTSPLRLAVCWRPIAARAGEEHVVTRLLRHRGVDAIQTEDAHLDLDLFDVVLVLENCRWFPTIMGELMALRDERPLLVAWHWEPLPLPKTAGVPPPNWIDITLHQADIVQERGSPAPQPRDHR